MRPVSILLLLILLLTAAPGAVAQDEPTVNSELLVEVEWLEERLDDDSVVVLHVASDEGQYRSEHIPGARFLLLGSILVTHEEELNALPPLEQLETVFSEVGLSNDQHAVIYGDMGGLAAARAFLTLDLLGHERVSLLDGGLEAWTAAGHATSTEPAEPEPGSFSGSVRTGGYANAEWIAERLEDPQTLLLDARPPEQYSGEVPGGGVERPGHIPNAKNFFWQEALVSEDNPVLIDEDALRQQYRELGINAEDTVVTYCRTGIQASHAYFVARYLGYDTRLYDPSFFHWSNFTDFPVASLD